MLHLDVVVLVDSGNVYDAVFMAARAALWDTKVPRTRSVEYKAKKGAVGAGGAVSGGAGKKGAGEGGGDDMDVDEEVVSGFDTRQIRNATDFELPDYWDEGEVLDGRDAWPVSVTLNLVRSLYPPLAGLNFPPVAEPAFKVPPTHFLDATLPEEAATSLRLLLMFAFDPLGQDSPNVQGMRTLGTGELEASQLQDLIKVSILF